MNTADVVHLSRDHPGAVRREDTAQVRAGKIGAVLGQQTCGAPTPAPVAAVA